MSGLYGSWLDESHDYEIPKSRIDSLHQEYFPKYQRRIAAVEAIAVFFVDELEDTFDNLKGVFQVSYPNILGCVGRYLNDIVHYKVWHEISDSKPSKMLSHMAKWAFHYPPVVTALSKAQYEQLTENEREVVLNINTIFIDQLFQYIIDGFEIQGVELSDYKKIFYLLETNQFDAKNATMLFESIL